VSESRHRLGLRAIVQFVVDWWLPSRKRLPKDRRKRFDTMFLLDAWLLWLERNARVFGSSLLFCQRPRDLLVRFQEEASAWSVAGFDVLADVAR
jgi:hypothetical protein